MILFRSVLNFILTKAISINMNTFNVLFIVALFLSVFKKTSTIKMYCYSCNKKNVMYVTCKNIVLDLYVVLILIKRMFF